MVEVTIRTILGIYFLKPIVQNTHLILGILGRAKALLGFELYGYAYLSNHGSQNRWHPILKGPPKQVAPDFKGDNAVPAFGKVWAPYGHQDR